MHTDRCFSVVFIYLNGCYDITSLKVALHGQRYFYLEIYHGLSSLNIHLSCLWTKILAGPVAWYSEPEFVNLLRSPRIDSQHDGIDSKEFLGSLNVYKFGLRALPLSFFSFVPCEKS
jgi:hypothetical protein